MQDKFIQKVAILIITAILFVLAFLMLKPIALALVFGFLFSYIFHPIYNWIHKYVKQKDLAAGVLLAFIILAIAIPVWFLTPIIIKQTFEAYTYFQTLDFSTTAQKLLPSIFTPELANSFAIQINNIISKIFSSFLTHISQILVDIPKLLLELAIFIFTFYFTIRDADKLKLYVLKLSPFSMSAEKKLLQEFRNITNSIIYGQVLIGVIQGLMLGAGLFLLGIPKALTLTAIAVILSIIPIFGAWLVWLPVSIFLIISGNLFSGIILLIYGALFVSTIDNVLRSIILSKLSTLPVSLALISTIAGLFYFGIPGLILGPLIVAYILILLDFYKEGKLTELFKKDEVKS